MENELIHHTIKTLTDNSKASIVLVITDGKIIFNFEHQTNELKQQILAFMEDMINI